MLKVVLSPWSTILCVIYSTQGFTFDFKPIPTLHMFLPSLQHSYFHSGQKPPDYPEFFLSPPASNPLASLVTSTFRITLESDYFSASPRLCPALIFHPDYRTSILTDVPTPPAPSPPQYSPQQSGLLKRHIRACHCPLSQPTMIGPHFAFPALNQTLSSSFTVPTHNVGLGTERDSPLPQGSEIAILFLFHQKLVASFRVQVSTQVSPSQSGPLITLSTIVPPSLSIPLSYAQSLHRTYNYGHFSKCLLLSLPQTETLLSKGFLVCCCSYRTQSSAWHMGGVC